MNTIAIVGCGKEKLSRASAARSLYTGQLFKKASAYAGAISDCWFIASARYGLLDPNQVIEPYDQTLTGCGRSAKAAFRHCVQADWAAFYSEFQVIPERLIILAGKEYVTGIVDTGFRQIPNIELPLDGLMIGERLARLNELQQLAPSPSIQKTLF